MINNTNVEEDAKNIELIDKHDKQTGDSKCCFYILECLFILCC
jgi:hypothetical protein